MDDNELLRVLAKKTGREVIPGEGGVYAVVCKDRIYDYAYSQDEAWAKLKCSAPDWRHSVDAALALPWPTADDAGYWTRDVHSFYGDDGWTHDVTLQRHEIIPGDSGNQNVEEGDMFYASGSDLAYALSECYAQWVEAQEQEGGK